MANGQAGGRARRDPSSSTTREEALNVWGKAIAAQHLRGESILQKPHSLLPPRTIPTAEPSENGSPVRPPNRFHGTNALILRTYSVEQGHEDPTFALEKTARRFNDMHGDSVRPLRRGAERVELPNSRADADEPIRTRQDVTLQKAGPNFDSFGEKVQGKAGDPKRDEHGNKVTELVDVEGSRRDAGVKVYYHRDDLDLPHLTARSRPGPDRREYLLANTLGRAQTRDGLQVAETKELAGRAELTMQPAGTKVGDTTLEKDTYTLRVAPQDTFSSEAHHRSAIIHELSRHSMCRDGNADALAVAKADPAEREKMPEFARSEVVASAASLEQVTSVGYEWQPPQYTREHERDIRRTQAEMLREPGGLAEVGRQVHRVERLNEGRAPTAYDQRDRNQARREAAPSVTQAARGFATRGARPSTSRAAPVPADGDKPDKPEKPARQSRGARGASAPASRSTGRTATAARDAAAQATGGRRTRQRPRVDIGDQAKDPAKAPTQATGSSQARGQQRGAPDKDPKR